MLPTRTVKPIWRTVTNSLAATSATNSSQAAASSASAQTLQSALSALASQATFSTQASSNVHGSHQHIPSVAQSHMSNNTVYMPPMANAWQSLANQFKHGAKTTSFLLKKFMKHMIQFYQHIKTLIKRIIFHSAPSYFSLFSSSTLMTATALTLLMSTQTALYNTVHCDAASTVPVAAGVIAGALVASLSSSAAADSSATSPAGGSNVTNVAAATIAADANAVANKAQPASLLTRFAALIIDASLVGVVSGIAGVMFSLLIHPSVSFLVTLAIPFAYDYYFMVREKKPTIGKAACGIRVQYAEPKYADLPLTPATVMARRASSIIALFGGIDYLWALFHPRGRTLHDIFTGTIVVVTDSHKME